MRIPKACVSVIAKKTIESLTEKRLIELKSPKEEAIKLLDDRRLFDLTKQKLIKERRIIL